MLVQKLKGKLGAIVSSERATEINQKVYRDLRKFIEEK